MSPATLPVRNSSQKIATTQSVEFALRDLFNIPVEVVCRTPENLCDELGVLESQLAKPMRAARLADFGTGRVCAHEALCALGIPATTIGVGEGREPLWPNGVVGSISHCRGIAAAAVSNDLNCLGLGLDIEPVSALERDVVRLICTDAEIAWIDEVCCKRPAVLTRCFAEIEDYQSAHLACLLFSIKEAIFKCYFPVYRHWFEFRQATVCLSLETGSWRVELDPQLPFAKLPDDRHLCGRFRIFAGYCLACAVLLHSS